MSRGGCGSDGSQRSSFQSQVHVLIVSEWLNRKLNLNLLQKLSLLPAWLCGLRQNCSSEVKDYIKCSPSGYCCPFFFNSDSLWMLPSDPLSSTGLPQPPELPRELWKTRIFFFKFSSSLHSILIDHRIIYLNQLISPENAKKLWRFFFFAGNLDGYAANNTKHLFKKLFFFSWAWGIPLKYQALRELTCA